MNYRATARATCCSRARRRAARPIRSPALPHSVRDGCPSSRRSSPGRRSASRRACAAVGSSAARRRSDNNARITCACSRVEPVERAADRPSVGVLASPAGDHRKPRLFPGDFHADPAGQLRVDATLKPQLAASVGDVEDATVGMYEPVRRVDPQADVIRRSKAARSAHCHAMAPRCSRAIRAFCDAMSATDSALEPPQHRGAARNVCNRAWRPLCCSGSSNLRRGASLERVIDEAG